MALYREGKRERFDPMVFERGRHSLNHGFVIEGGVWIRENVRRFSGIDASLSMDEIQPFRQVVVRRELLVGDRPSW